MNVRRHLPLELSGRSFATQEAIAYGVTLSRLRASDLVTPTRGIRVPWDSAPTPVGIVRPLLAVMPDAVASFITAARIWGVPLPPRFRDDFSLHVTRPPKTPLSERPGIVCHRMRLGEPDVVLHQGVRLTSPLRTLLDLAGVLPRDDIVAIGDYLVCEHPAGFPAPRDPLYRIEQIGAYLEAQRRVRGLPAAKRALNLVRVGADSVPETKLRLAIVDAGLPEPVLNYVIRDRFGRAVAWPDQAFVEARFVVQYDGEHHRTAEQQASDNWRNRFVADEGWDQLVVSNTDVRRRGWDGVARVIGQRLARAQSRAQLSA